MGFKMKLTYAYKELFYEVENTDEIKNTIRKLIKKYGPLDRTELECNDNEIWWENWVPKDYDADQDLQGIVDKDVFFSFKSDSKARKFDIYFRGKEE